jgi:hypothetical protein
MSYHLTPKEVYWIAYLTAHGWEPDWDVELWRKEGFMNKVAPKGKDCYFEHEMVESEWFEAESAYWEQKTAQEVDSEPKDDHDTIPSPPPEGVEQEL